MGFLIFLLLTALPVVEFSVAARVAARIGFFNMLMLLAVSVVFGGYLAKAQGRMVLLRIQQCLAEGRKPTTEMIDGLLIFAGGLLFIFPGFVSDLLGLVLIMPFTRWLVRFFIQRGFVFDGTNVSQGRSSQKPKVPPTDYDRGTAEDAQIVE